MPNLNVISTSPKDKIFSLIKSLTKAEKRNFKLYANRTHTAQDVKFIQLFDVVDKLEDYEETVILKKISGLKKQQLANLKRHLYKQILISLRLIHISKNVDIQIREKIDFAKILYGKGLYLQSLKILDRIKIVAIENHQDLLLVEILEFEKLIEERHITRSRTIKNKVESLMDDAERWSAVMHNSAKLTNLKIEIHGFYIQFGHAKSEKDSIIVNEIFKARLASIATHDLTFFERVYLNQAYVWYYYILLDFSKCYDYACKWVDIFHQKPHMREDDPDLYMRGLHYILTALFNMGDYEHFITYLDEFETFQHSFGKQMNQNSKMIAFLYLYTAKLNKHNLEGSFGEGVKLIPPLMKMIKTFERQLDPHRIMVFYFKMAYMHFGNANYNRALDFLSHIINLTVGHLREDIQCYSRLLNLIAHFELGHFQLLEYLVSSTQRFLDKMRELNMLQKETLNFIGKIAKEPHKNPKPAFISFHKTLEKIAKDPFEKRAFLYLDIMAWVDSKIEEKPLSEIVGRGKPL